MLFWSFFFSFGLDFSRHSADTSVCDPANTLQNLDSGMTKKKKHHFVKLWSDFSIKMSWEPSPS